MCTVQKVDSCYKIKVLDSNTYIYNTMDPKKKSKNSNELKMISITYSAFSKSKIFEELDGKIVEFMVDQHHLLVLTKPLSDENLVLRALKFKGSKPAKPKCNIKISDPILKNYIQVTDQIQNNMIPVGNHLFTLVLSGEKPKLIDYKKVIPIGSQGDKVAFGSPIINFFYRKMLYFISNKSQKKEKRGIVLPYLNENYSVFTKKEGSSQFAQFFEYKDNIGKDHFDILNFLPDA
jgi:hypothetical protein